MGRKNLYTLLIGILIAALLNGCSTTKNKPDIAGEPAPASSEEVPQKVSLNEFILGPGDKVEIIVYRHDDLKRTVQIDLSGKITYPLVGDIQTGGLSIFQLRDRLKEGLSKYIIDPQVSLGVTTVQSQKIVVLGEVKTPGFFQIETTLSALEAISMAGGFTLDGKKESILLIRGGTKKPELMSLNLEKALKDGDLTQNIMLQRGDIIYVPRTFIANVDRFFNHLATIISPLLQLESGYYIGQQIEASGGGASVPAR